MRGLEPPPGCPDTDLNRARLPIPPHPPEARRYRSRSVEPSGQVGRPAAETAASSVFSAHLAATVIKNSDD